MHDPLRGRRVAGVVGRHHADAERLRLRQHVAVAVGTGGVEVALHLKVDAVAPEDVAERGQIGARRGAGEHGQPARVRGQQIGGRVQRIRLLLPTIHFGGGDQLTEVLVAAPILDQQEDRRRPRCQRDLRADDGAQAGLARRREEAGRAVDAVAIGERQRVVTAGRRRRHQILRQRRAVEKTERRSAAQLDVIGSSHSSRRETSARRADPGERGRRRRPTRARPSTCG